MRGFQPQHYADGGLVQRAMSLIGGRKKQIDEATKVAVQTPRQPEPQPVVTSTPDAMRAISLIRSRSVSGRTCVTVDSPTESLAM